MDIYEMLAALQRIRAVGPDEPECGICRNALVAGGKAWLNEHFELWPEYSGNKWVPVAHPDYACPIQAYDRVENKWEGPYGEARKRLLNFLIECATAEAACAS